MLQQSWPSLRFINVKIENQGSQQVFEVELYLDNLDPNVVKVELFATGMDPKPMDHVRKNDTTHTYRVAMPANRSPADYTARVNVK